MNIVSIYGFEHGPIAKHFLACELHVGVTHRISVPHWDFGWSLQYEAVDEPNVIYLMSDDELAMFILTNVQ